MTAILVYCRIMRIIAGKKRGMKLLGPSSEISRPILDRVKESIFDVLYKYDVPDGKMVADLFCGVGSFGLESLSRGAIFVNFVEKDRKIASILEKNIAKADFLQETKVLRGNAFKIGAPFDEEKYDLVFVDPPYPLTREVGVGSQLAGLMEILVGQVKEDGLVVVRTEKHVELEDAYGRLEVIDRRRWGTMNVAILQLAPAPI